MGLCNAFIVQGNISAALKPPCRFHSVTPWRRQWKERDGVGNALISTCW
jgi:hypothetical protein